jgi:predicted dienelactone hydrolase
MRALKSSFEDPANLQARVADLQFVLDTLEKHIADNSPLGQMIDPDRIGAAGHAFGALAALVMAGQHAVVLQNAETGPDPRIKAVLALSSPVLFDDLNYQEAYKDVRIPALHMTGTNDDSPVGPTRAAHRRIPFDNIRGADQFLITFSGADHLTFSGHLRDRAARNDSHFQARIASASTAFWLAYLKDSPQLRSLLAEGGMETIVGSIGRVEYKGPSETASSTQGGRAASQYELPLG